jgi:hypothetical protein
MQKRENERQAAQRARSHTHLREAVAAEAVVPLKAHQLDEGHRVLQGACTQLMRTFSADVPMRLPPGEYLRLLSPATYASEPPTCARPSAPDAG